MTDAQKREIVNSVMESSPADQTQAALTSGKWALTRFANSSIHQNMTGANSMLRVMAVYGKRFATASSNVITREGVRELVARANEMARLADPNPDFVSLPEPTTPAAEVDPWREATARSTPAERADLVSGIVARADRINGSAAGSVFTRSFEKMVMNSLGVDAHFRGTAANVVTVVTAPDGGFGYASGGSMDIGDLDGESIGEEASQRANAGRNPIDIEAGDYECVLLPYAVADIVRMLAWIGFTALNYQEGRSFVSGKLGAKIVSDQVSIYDDAYDARTYAQPFDCEGVAKQRVELISRGVASGVLYCSYTAHREGKRSTGHSFGEDYELSGSSANIVFAAGHRSLDDMISSIRKGLLVTRFHYTNVVHPMSATLTGMTRDGTFLIENGTISRPVKNLRFTQSILEAFNDVRGVGRDLKLEDGILAPALHLGRFRFSSATEF